MIGTEPLKAVFDTVVHQRSGTEGKDASALSRLKCRVGKFRRIGDPAWHKEVCHAENLIRRMEFCYTPKHGSWLNIAENELSSLTRQCVADRRFADVAILQGETAAWSTDVTATQRGVDWQMKIDDARTKLKSVYPTIKL